MLSFADHRGLVAGASSGIGRAVALELARHGAEILGVARRPAPLEDLVRDILAEGGAARSVTADLTDPEAVDRVVADAGELDLLILSLGTFRLGRIDEGPADQLRDVLATNLDAPWHLVRAALPTLRRRQGQIVFVNSTAGVASRGGVGAYAASKHALKALADAVRDEVNPDGVRVLSIYPGRTATPMQEEVVAAEGRPYRPERLLQPEDVATMVRAALALPRTAEVTDLHLRPMLKG